MTTIVYDHKNKQIAIDSRATAMGMIKTDTKRFYHVVFLRKYGRD